jgi:hypothetical protein
MSFCPETPKLPKLGLSRLWGPITLCTYLWWRWVLKQSCSPPRKLSSNMLQVTYTQGNRVDSWLLVVGSQIANLIPYPSFGHNLCFRCPNGSCELILDIYVPRAFQWYKEFPNPMRFGPCNCSLKIWESTGTLIPKMGAHLGMWVFIFTFSPLPDFPLGSRPCLRRKPKARVATH